MSRSMQGSLAQCLQSILETQQSSREQMTSLATLLKRITPDTSDSVIADMTNFVVGRKDDPAFQEAFLIGMTS